MESAVLCLEWLDRIFVVLRPTPQGFHLNLTYARELSAGIAGIGGSSTGAAPSPSRRNQTTSGAEPP